MIVKIISLFLIGMLVLAMFGKLRVGGFARILGIKSPRMAKPLKCTRCGAYQIGKAPCTCPKG